jgi:hypothetical protein
LRTLLVVVITYLRRLLAQLPWLLLVLVVTGVLLFGSNIILTHLLKNTVHVGLKAPFLELVAYGLVLLLISVSCAGLLWRGADRNLLGGGIIDKGFPVFTLFKAALFLLAMLGGGAVIVYACLKAIPFRLHELGVPPPYDRDAVALVLALCYFPLLLRVQMLVPLVALDSQRVMPAWRLVLKTLAGKTVPLLAGLLFQILVCAPFLLVAAWLASRVYTAATAVGGSLTTQSQLLLVLAGVVALAVAISLMTALQAGAVRHFFGYGTEENVRYQERLLVADPNEVYVMPTPHESNEPFAEGYGQTRVKPREDVAYFDITALEDTEDLTPSLPPVYQPPSAPPLSLAPPAPTAPAESPPLPELTPLAAPPMGPRPIPPAPAPAPAPAEAGEMPKWVDTEDENPFAAFELVDAGEHQGDEESVPPASSAPVDEDPFAGMR